MELRKWVIEREKNCERIALTKSADDRAEWLEDAKYFREILTALARRPAPEGWIAVSERPLPKDGGTYLVCAQSGQVAPHIRGIIHNNTGDAMHWQYGEAIAYWQPLPAPPVEQQKAEGEG